jgi:glycosyltransferase involved in cell wall biosynthesis
MYREKKISLVIPAYNEEKLILPTLERVPELIDKIYVVDDCSPDGQNQVVEERSKIDSRVILVKHETNRGPGGSIITGYKKSIEDGIDIAVVIGGDNQMPIEQVEEFLDPIIDGKADYTKGNRFLLAEVLETKKKMPRLRLFANWGITFLTKIASGYYKIMDVVDGYTAISREAMEAIDWDIAWQEYGYPMDFLVRLNAYGFRVKDISRKAIYTEGERQSQIKGARYALRVSPMLIRDFFWRLKFKYMYRDFHPLILCYFASFILIPLAFLSGIYLVIDKMFLGGGGVTASKAVLVALFFLMGSQFFFFATLFDMENDK